MTTRVGISDRSIAITSSVSEVTGLRPSLLPSARRTAQEIKNSGSGRTRQRNLQCRSPAATATTAAAADCSASNGQDFARQTSGWLNGRACLICAAQGCVSCVGVPPRVTLPSPGCRRRYSRRRVFARGSQGSAGERFLESESGGSGESGLAGGSSAGANSSSISSGDSDTADRNRSNGGETEGNGRISSSSANASSSGVTGNSGSAIANSNGTGNSNGNGAVTSFNTAGYPGGAGGDSSSAVAAPPAVTPDTLWEELLPCITYLSPTQLQVVRHALRLAYRAHDGQKRKSGEPYIIHPVEVARILGQLEMDWETVVAGLLHDTVEDTDVVSFEQIEASYGPAVRRIVEGETKVSKLGKVKDGSKADVKADDLRQMFLAMTEEVRVIIVKLADRLHNMRTLTHMPPHKQKYIAMETLSVFAPLARLLGMYHIKTELEDLSFRYAYPEEYLDVSERMLHLCTQQQPALDEARVMLEEAMRKDKFLDLMTSGARVETRCKEPYSIFKKVVETGAKVEEIHEISQIRVVLSMDDAADQQDSSSRNIAQQVSYHVLGLVHALWRPLPGTVKDYIATPKPNGYQSLHTTVLPLGASSLFPVEVQIRTDHMDKLAEWGIAAHHTGRHPHLLLHGQQEEQQQGQGQQGKQMKTQGQQGKQERQGQVNQLADGSEDLAGLLLPGLDYSTTDDSEGDSDSSGSDDEPGRPPLASTISSVAVCGGVTETQSSWGNDADVARRVSWLNSIREWQEEFVGAISAREFVDTVTCDLFGSRIFVFTPKGEVKNLPKGATVIDYAYHIHTDVGNRMVAAKVNGNFVPPTYALSNGEVVEVLTYKGGSGGSRKGFKQRQQWLQHAKTRSARHKLTKPTQSPSIQSPSSSLPFDFSPSTTPSAAPSPRSRPLSSPPSATKAVPQTPNKGRQGRLAVQEGEAGTGSRKGRSGEVERSIDGTLGGREVELGRAESGKVGSETGAAGERGSEGLRFSDDGAAADVASARLAAGDADVSLASADVELSRGRSRDDVDGSVGAGVGSREGVDELVSRLLEGLTGEAQLDGGSSGRGRASEGGGACVDAFAEFEEWQTQTVAMWQFLSGRRKVVLWLAVQCYDRTGMLAEVSKIVTESGLLIFPIAPAISSSAMPLSRACAAALAPSPASFTCANSLPAFLQRAAAAPSAVPLRLSATPSCPSTSAFDGLRSLRHRTTSPAQRTSLRSRTCAPRAMASAEVIPAVIIGAGRVGQALEKMGGGRDVVVRRGEKVPERGEGPIIVCTRNDALDAVVDAVPESRREDLVFIQNGMLDPWLTSRGLQDATQVLVYFAVAKAGDPPLDGITDVNPEGLTAATGKWAEAVAARLKSAGLSCKVLSPSAFRRPQLEKLMWICAFMLVGARNGGITVGEVESQHREAVTLLINELAAAAVAAGAVDGFDEGLVERLCAYARSVAHFPTAVKEFEWRNGWFYSMSKAAVAAGKPDPCPLHSACGGDAFAGLRAEKRASFANQGVLRLSIHGPWPPDCVLSSAASLAGCQIAAPRQQQTVRRSLAAVRCEAASSDDKHVVSRRSATALGLAALLAAIPASSASAKDIPLFGIRRKAVEEEAPAAAPVAAPVVASSPAAPVVAPSVGVPVTSESDIPAETQAVAVAAVEVVAVLTAGAIVKSVTS
ncbi:unnamed protein product [Closterium sp. Yama58-4]|nr:unnamed protein product [Closterium sp. Yama58-4]